ncbi:hypothetical protein CHARACLAT_025592 [Characodon lateralis]|uniref:Uncharacterized protein n=1 Tax=Characodon lateralis TaxID=208331 RepID=A0ABU7CUN2_9TELE|nr:hypothetical protein [Characodon lateralis]
MLEVIEFMVLMKGLSDISPLYLFGGPYMCAVASPGWQSVTFLQVFVGSFFNASKVAESSNNIVTLTKHFFHTTPAHWKFSYFQNSLSETLSSSPVSETNQSGTNNHFPTLMLALKYSKSSSTN